jgi:fermentation-respiration switch protein FrsA (DUF1100 family)
LIVDLEKDLEIMDRPQILSRLFFPRQDDANDPNMPGTVTHFTAVADGISISSRFYPAGNNGPNILYFHGNGEIAQDYDYVAPVYTARGLNLFVVDYRGYGLSNGIPGCTNMIRDAHPIFHDFRTFLRDSGYTGDIYIMGRSLGSAPAIEVAYHYQKHLKGLIVESGFAGARNQFARLGVSHLFRNIENPVGFGNDLKIKDIFIPTLIIHGEVDTIIPAAEGKTLYDISGSKEKYSLFVSGAGHNDLMIESLELYMRTIERFINRS